MALIYKIENKKTHACYVGSTHGFPFGRWAEHVGLLGRGIHHSAKFQTAWDASAPTDWMFDILEAGIEESHRLHREQHWFETLQPGLNGTSRITRMIDRQHVEAQAAKMLDEGCTYRRISKTLGCSVGWLTLFKRRRLFTEHGSPFKSDGTA
jgi:GIY-YIG catalytic domain